MKGLLELYSLRVPEYIKEYAEAEEMQRIRHVDMNCGMNYTSFPLFKDAGEYTRYEHSLGVAYILAGFTDKKEIILSGLFHDIAAPVFSHVIDFLNGDHEHQESTEDETASLIAGSAVITGLLERDGITKEQVSDYHMYPLADNDSPRLSADRLEYTFGNMVNYGFATLEQVRTFLNDLTVSVNEDGMPEMSFRTPETAEEFALLSLKCGHVYSCDHDRYGMEYLALLLKKAVSEGILEYDDFRRTEAEVIAVLESSTLQEEWKAFRKMSSLKYSPEQKEGYLQVHAKRRYIDPLCGNVRVSSYSEKYSKALHDFLSEDQDVWMRAENLKGE